MSARRAALAALAIVLAYLGFFNAVIQAWATHRYGGHLLFVPIFAAGLVCLQHRDLLRRPLHPSPGGAGVVGLALGVLGIAYVTANVPLQALSFVGAVGGWVLWTFGRRALHELRFVLVFLLLMAPPPQDAVAAVAPAVQEFVAAFCGVVLRGLQIPVEQQGIFLHLPGLVLEVAEECAGLRFLAILVVFVAAFGRAVLPTTRTQLVLIALSVPVAVAANTLRVATTGVAAYAIGPHIATGPAHYYIGKSFWAIALLAMVAVACVLRARAHRALADGRPHYVLAAAAKQ